MSEFTEGVTAPEETKEETQEQSTTEDYLEQWVGEGKKYATVEDAAKALAKKAVNADNFIETLKSEKRQLEEQYNELQTRNKSIDEIVAALRTPEPPKQEPNVSEQSLSVDEIIAELEKRNQQKSEAEKRENAIKAAWEMIGSQDGFGDMEKAKLAVSGYIKNDPNRKALVDQLAVTDPKGLITLLKQSNPPVTFSEDTNSVSTESVTVGDGKLTWDIVNKVRKENPELYNSKAFKNRMHHEL